MKKPQQYHIGIILLLLMLGGITIGKAQTHEFAPIGAEWFYGYGDFFTQGYVHFIAEKDTIVDGVACLKLVKRNYVYNNLSQTLYDYKGGLDEYVASINDKVYLYGEQGFQLWFDFDAEVGDSWPLPSHYYDLMLGGEAGSLVVEAKGAMWVNGYELRYIDVRDGEGSEFGYGWYHLGVDSPYTVRVCERIGPLDCYLFPISHVEEDNIEGGSLRCYQDDEIGSVSYFSGNCDYINQDYQMVEEEHEAGLIVFPNPFQDQFTIHCDDDTVQWVRVYDALGQLVLEKEWTENEVQVDMSEYSSGIYNILLGGEQRYQSRIIRTQ